MVSQIKLIAAIGKNLDKQGVKSLVPRQYNAIIEAANIVIAAIEQEPCMAKEAMGLDAWLRSDDVGQSSAYMASVMGGFVRPYAHPYGADDFGRCHRLLIAVPEFRDRLEMMRDKSEQWAALLDCWGAIVDRIEAKDYKTANKYVTDAISSR